MSKMESCVFWIGLCLLLADGLETLRGRGQSWSLTTLSRLSCGSFSCSEVHSRKVFSALLKIEHW